MHDPEKEYNETKHSISNLQFLDIRLGGFYQLTQSQIEIFIRNKSLSKYYIFYS